MSLHPSTYTFSRNKHVGEAGQRQGRAGANKHVETFGPPETCQPLRGALRHPKFKFVSTHANSLAFDAHQTKVGPGGASQQDTGPPAELV